MEYTVQKLGKLAGISTRTLRYYDEIGILKPARINSSEYRIYGTAEVNRLRQILFYLLIANVEKTIDLTEGRIKMSDKEKFEGFKKKMVEENEEKYGEEIKKRYGKDMVEKSNEKVLNMTKEQYNEVTVLEEKVKTTLVEAFKTGDPAGELAQKAVHLHKKWLKY